MHHIDIMSRNMRTHPTVTFPVLPHILTSFALWIAIVAIPTDHAVAQVVLPKLVGDGMVLQRGSRTDVWGWAAPGEIVTLTFQESTVSTTTSVDGRWSVRLPELIPGGPYHMEITASNRIRLDPVYVGDVWIASGQSNMELPMHRVRPLYQADIDASDEPRIRFFDVPQRFDFNTPWIDLPEGSWKAATPSNTRRFSAVAYFFARELLQATGVPVGIVHASLGGSPAEAWMSEEALKAFPSHLAEALRWRDASLIRATEESDKTRIQAWYNESVSRDEGYRTHSGSWAHPETDVSTWERMTLPGFWNTTPLGPINGVVWFRKDVDLPTSAAGRKAFLELGRIVDADSTFINGRFVGTVTYQYPPRWYDVPEGILKAGHNTVAVRVTNESGYGGFVPDRRYELRFADQSVDLGGEWRYRLGTQMDPLGSQTFIRWKPMGLFNAMIAPVSTFAVSGVIWYQGESNTGRAEEYGTLFPALIADWRRQWNRHDLPFLYVQLAGFMEAKPEPGESQWARLRDAQFKTLSVPNTGMAVTIDIGEWNDIHPLNKKDVGKRLALAARRVVLRDSATVTSGPLFRSMTIDGHRILIDFDHVGSGLVALGGEPRHVAIAGPDGGFVWAQARIEGNRLIAWHPDIPHPVAVRYAWADNPDTANLYNREGLPASPFRTD